jgi:hypothetical protein
MPCGVKTAVFVGQDGKLVDDLLAHRQQCSKAMQRMHMSLTIC